MVNYSESLDTVFSALSDSTRRALIAQLVESETTVKKLAEPFNMSLPAISKHLRVLENAGLMTRRRQGRTHYCRANIEPLNDAVAWINRYQDFWNKQLDSLEDYLKKTTTKEKK